MKKKLHFPGNKCVLFLSLLFLSQTIFGQAGSVDAGISIGPANLLGDLGGNTGRGTAFLKDNNFSQTKLMVGGHLTFNVKDWLSYRLAVNFGSVQGDDNIIKGKGGLEEARKARGLNVKSPIIEALVMAEIYPTVLLEDFPEDVYHKVRPYGVIGIGGFYFNPKGQDPATGEWIALKGLRTEGQGFQEYPSRKEYKLLQVNIPMGIGVKYFVSERASISLEILHRITFTDYIDDVSTTYIDPSLFSKYLPAPQAAIASRLADKRKIAVAGAGDKRGTATNNDGYYSVGFKFSFQLIGENGIGNSTRCPVIRY
ncbi:MAG: hypothetical protein H7Y03_10530 [Chitinophagaceae bacterium]|nr:hypothetical protein [Chitinophagaceae bacterium]